MPYHIFKDGKEAAQSASSLHLPSAFFIYLVATIYFMRKWLALALLTAALPCTAQITYIQCVALIDGIANAP